MVENGLSETDAQRFARTCRKAGMRVTPQRLEIYREIADARDHPTAEVLFERLRRRMPTLSLDTVYRTLDALERFGSVLKLRTLEESARFDGNPELHHHIVCTDCGRIEDAAWPDFDQLRLPGSARQWGEIHHRQAQLRGVCRECLERKRRAERPVERASTRGDKP